MRLLRTSEVGRTRRYKVVPDDARGCQTVSEGTRWCQMVQENARWCQRVPEGARGARLGRSLTPALGKASELIFVKVSIAGVEVDALVDTGATTSCCRWGWYQKWHSHLGSLMKSSLRIIGVGHDPIKVKGAVEATDATMGWCRRPVPADGLVRSD